MLSTADGDVSLHASAQVAHLKASADSWAQSAQPCASCVPCELLQLCEDVMPTAARISHEIQSAAGVYAALHGNKERPAEHERCCM